MQTRNHTHTTKLHVSNKVKDPVMVATAAIEDIKGLDIVTLALTNGYTDHLVIATGTSERHVQSIADRVSDYFHKAGIVVDSIEGSPNNHWVIVDAGDIVVHVFTKETRDLYNLEKLYSHNFDDMDMEDDDDDVSSDLTGS